MRNAPEAVCIYIPLMKDLGMSWTDIKQTSRVELEGLLSAYSEYLVLHSYDGYSDKDISEMAKNKPGLFSPDLNSSASIISAIRARVRVNGAPYPRPKRMVKIPIFQKAL